MPPRTWKHRLYLTNLPDKINKNDLRLSLYTLFSTYGPVLDVNALRGNAKMRNQAHVAFRDVQTATQAMRSLQGFEFFGKELKVQYAKGKSDTVAKLDGTYKMGGAAAATAASGQTELQQQIFGAPPSSLPQKLVAPAAAADSGAMDVDGKEGPPKGVKRGREDDEDESESGGEAPMEEDSDASMEEESDDD